MASARERRILLPILRKLSIAEWRLERGLRQSRTDLKTQAELDDSLVALDGADRGLSRALRNYRHAASLGKKLTDLQHLVRRARLRTELAQLRLQLRRGSTAGAVAWLEKARRTSPRDPEVQLLDRQVRALNGNSGK